jgi:CheY-like chemotaxis protein
VLVVEDDPDARIIYQATLAHEGYIVATARTIAEGRERASARKPDVVVLDCRLPDGNGLDLLATWKRSPSMAPVPVVVVTAFSQPADIDAATRAGADAFMVKPCPGVALSAFLHRLMSAKAPTRRPPRLPTTRKVEAPPIIFPCGGPPEAVTLQRIDATRFQARCEPCLRPSPILRGTITEAASKIVELGWTAGPTTWTCPICRDRAEQPTGRRRRLPAHE